MVTESGGDGRACAGPWTQEKKVPSLQNEVVISEVGSMEPEQTEGTKEEYSWPIYQQ